MRTERRAPDPDTRAPEPGGNPGRQLFIEGATLSPSWRWRRQLNILPRYGWLPGAGAGSPASARGTPRRVGGLPWNHGRGHGRRRASGAWGWRSSCAAADRRVLWAPGVAARGGPGSRCHRAAPRPAPPAALSLRSGAPGSARGPGPRATPAAGCAGRGPGRAEAGSYGQVGTGHSRVSGSPLAPGGLKRWWSYLENGGRMILIPEELGRFSDGAQPAQQLLHPNLL